MPLRDHFRPPVDPRHAWEGFHAVWPTTLLQDLVDRLPPGYIAEPRAHLGRIMEVDVGTFEDESPPTFDSNLGGGGVALAPAPVSAASDTALVETESPEEAEFELLVYNADRARTLVAAIEWVSPSNLDRPDSRTAFVTKCATLLRAGVAVTVIDIVTVRLFNLYTEVRDFVGHPDPRMPTEAAPPVYAASCRWLRRGRRGLLESRAVPLVVGQALPTLPLWLGEDLMLPLDLEVSYEQACRALRIT